MNAESTNGDCEHAKKLAEIFLPYATRRHADVVARDGRFVHYTSASSGLQIIKSKELWMRNTTCMSDFSEVQHGFQTLQRFFAEQNNKQNFFEAVDACFSGIARESIKLFDEWLHGIQYNTYIASISEHDESEDNHGRLSMWRAFSRNTARVALVFRAPLNPDSAQSLNVVLSPVAYFSDEDVRRELSEVINNINTNKRFLQIIDRQQIINSIFNMLAMAAVSLKHQGFYEEREWRAIYIPKLRPSPIVRSSLEVIDGIPQVIYKIPLDGQGSDDLKELTLPRLLDRVIIGPSLFPWVMYEAFTSALMDAGVKDAGAHVFVSGIPLRT